jgi:hypothetical protein
MEQIVTCVYAFQIIKPAQFMVKAFVAHWILLYITPRLTPGFI